MIPYAAVLQTSWDWRAAGNFMLGGTGGALLLAVALTGAATSAHLPATLLAMALMGGGLALVWLEIGRPWRAAHVMFKPQNSWMTREAYVAGCAILLAAASVSFQWIWLAPAAGLSGIAFLYCQARILRAATGIPAWREPVTLPLILVTGLLEGTACLIIVRTVLSESTRNLLIVLAGLTLLRLFVWNLYRRRLVASDPPREVVAALKGIGFRFVLFGHLLPLLLVAWSSISPSSDTFGTLLAALLTVLSGWHAKFALVTRLAHVQGFGFGASRRGHPLRLTGHRTMSESSVRLRKTRESAGRCQGDAIENPKTDDRNADPARMIGRPRKKC